MTIDPVFSPVFRSSIFNGVFPITGPAAPTSPVDLFATGAQGLWYDPADLTTMFQDSAGTIPVTAPGQPVGRRVDLSGRSNNSTQSIANSRLTYGIEPKTGTRNLLQRTEEFENAFWGKSSTTVAANAAVAPNGTLTADTATFTVTGQARITATFTIVAGTTYSFSAYFKDSNTNLIGLGVRVDSVYDRAIFDLSNQTINTSFAGTRVSSPVITDVGGGWFRCSAQILVPTLGTTNQFFFTGGAGFTGTIGDSYTVWGAQLGVTSLTDYQKVVTAFEVTEAGVPSCHYCQYDGSDDSMGTAAIDFTGTDAMSVFAGVFKRSDAALGTVLELSVDAVNNNGAFALRAPNTTASAAYSYLSRGTALALATTPTTFPAPRHNVLTGLSDISADQSVARVNGVQVVSSASDQGTGTYGNYALFSGRRNNTNLPFAGRDYGMLVVGKNASVAEIAFMEAWYADRTPTVTI